MKGGRLALSLITALVGLALLAGLYVAGERLDLRWDSTRGKRHSLTEQTGRVLREMPRPVHVTAFYRPSEPGKQAAQDLLELYAGASDRFTFEFLDPDRRLVTAREMGVTQTGTLVVSSGGKREKMATPDEERLTNAVIRVSQAGSVVVYAVAGHGEVVPDTPGEDGMGRLVQELSDKEVLVEPLLLGEAGKVPDDATAVLVLGPRRDFLDRELAILDGYVKEGGSLLAALSAEGATNFSDWLENTLGVRAVDGMVVDPVGELLVGDALMAVAQEYPDFKVAEEFTFMTLLPTARPLSWRAGGKGLARLAQTGPEAWAERDMDALSRAEAAFDEGADAPGPLWLAATVVKEREEGGETRAVVVGDQDFLTDRFIGLGGNMDLALASLTWLTSSENLVRIETGGAAGELAMLSPGAGDILTWLPGAALPLMTLIVGVLVAWRRKKG
ncbi:GldG family protein [Desulfohalovibrio reitneri]|uniref:GldG family protein n=1 Tax=Desulfohalovibrio reitneri TaxID=1307759 RepID=UPI000AD26884|nr:GldG family protein [Desulfohalovibrio reitneri]